ncbi:MAG: phosphoadenylyl-sulfate reductase [Nannocystis sp.]|nr:phosphoadenylyl-sulfate reductase [Nannocystis sp.]
MAEASARLETATAQEVLAWTFARFGTGSAPGASSAAVPSPAPGVGGQAQGQNRGLRVGLSSAFGAEGCALIHLAREQQPDVPVYTIDTGYLFAESVALREAYRAMGADIRVVEPLVSIRTQAERHGPDLFARDPDACCEIRKVEPMRRILTFLDVWITAVRRDQSDTRQHTPVVGTARRADGSLVIKVAPLVRWSRRDTWRYIFDHQLPYNRLLDEGYTSIGCEPCTKPTTVEDADGEPGERSGRWVGTAKTECGIHHL